VAFALVVPAATLIRTRGNLLVYARESGVVDNPILVGVGLGITSAEAFAAGVGSNDVPLDDIESSWFWYASCTLYCDGTTSAPDAGTRWLKVPIDSKAMRKMKSDDTIFLAAEGWQSTATSGTVVEVQAHYRHQFKL